VRSWGRGRQCERKRWWSYDGCHQPGTGEEWDWTAGTNRDETWPTEWIWLTVWSACGGNRGVEF
jgi:hypothetical protein